MNNKLKIANSEIAGHSPKARLDRNYQQLTYLKDKLIRSMSDILNAKDIELNNKLSVIELLDPKLPLNKGYMMATDKDTM